MSSAVWLILVNTLCLHLPLGRRFAEVVFDGCNPWSTGLLFEESPHRASIKSYRSKVRLTFRTNIFEVQWWMITIEIFAHIFICAIHCLALPCRVMWGHCLSATWRQRERWAGSGGLAAHRSSWSKITSNLSVMSTYANKDMEPTIIRWGTVTD